jgi:hypothetical protein
VYARIHDEHPEVPIVIHILPEKNSKDYGAVVLITSCTQCVCVSLVWMKDLSALYGLARQGILSSNVLNRFEDCPPPGGAEHALNNMSSWLSHRMHELAIGRT